MARTPAQRGRTGTWLVQSRLARGYETQAMARREIERLTGWRIPQSQYAEWESGRRVPSEAAQERLQAFYGPPEPTGSIETPDSLVAAISGLVAALDEERRQRVAFQLDLLEAIRELAQAAGRLREPEPEPPVSTGR